MQRRKKTTEGDEEDALPTVNDLKGGEAAAIGGVNRETEAMTSKGSSLLPPLFTPSIQKTLTKAPAKAVPLPSGVTTAVLKSRLDGKKVK